MKMKTILFLSALFVFSMYGRSVEPNVDSMIPRSYSIVSNELDKSLKKKTFKIQGVVKMFSSNNPMSDVLVGTTETGTWTRSDKEGKFELVLSAEVKQIYIYLEGWSEIIIQEAFEAQHVITLDVWLYQVQNQNVRKPVIYLYSEEELSVSVKLSPIGNMTFSYPAYKEGWSVKTGEEGWLSEESTGQAYPYLFWEAENDKLFYTFHQNDMEGFLIKTDTAINFLETQLSGLGLNAVEQTDFITYWAPILAKNPFALIQFYVDEAYDQHIAGIEVDPQPTAMRRVYMLCSGLKTEHVGMDLTPQVFDFFDRKGLTLVEWGGSEIDLNIIKP